MGANASSSSGGGGRTVTVDNDIPVGVVNLSDEVVQRLKGQHVRSLEAARRDAEEAAARRAALPNAGVVASAAAAGGGEHHQRQVFYGGEPTATAVEVRRQKDAELRANDAHWAKRLAQQELTQQKHNAVREREFNAALEDVRGRFQNAPPQHQPAPCREFKQRLVDCYRQHPGQTLRCTALVEQFTHCVSKHRTNVLDVKHGPTAAAEAQRQQPQAVAAH